MLFCMSCSSCGRTRAKVKTYSFATKQKEREICISFSRFSLVNVYIRINSDYFAYFCIAKNLKMNKFVFRCKKAIKEATPAALRTAWWMVRITVSVSFLMFLLKFSGILIWISVALGPFFHLFGLPGDAALAYISGYFINVYSCVAVLSTIDIPLRAITIIGAMTLAAHAMPVESAVQKKTGSSLLSVLLVRTLGSFVLGFLLNLLLPGSPDFSNEKQQALSLIPFFQIQGNFLQEFLVWGEMICHLILKMLVIIYVLNMLQRLLREFGILEYISKMIGFLMSIFGLPRKLSFLWIIANVLGLSYGAAIMIDEAQSGKLTKREIDLLNAHIGISHSNVEDLALVTMAGASCGIVLVLRWLMSLVVVWCFRLYYWFLDRKTLS